METEKKRKFVIGKSGAYSRTLDWDYPTNRWIFILSNGFGLWGTVAAYRAGSELLPAIWQGALFGLAVVMAWILGREIDPDQEISAFVAVVLAGLMWWSVTVPVQLLTVLFVIVYTRLLNRISGPRPVWVDEILPVVLAVYIAYQYGWFYGALAGAAYLLDTRLSRPAASHLWIGLGLLAVTAGMYFYAPAAESFPRTMEWGVVVWVISVLYVWHIFMTKNLTSKTDVGAHALDEGRVRLGQGFLLVVGLGAWLLFGDLSMYALMPVWAAMAAISFYRVAETLNGTFEKTKANG